MRKKITPRSSAPVSPVSYDKRAILINGKRELLVSAEIHYARIPEGEWEAVLDATKADGINCVASYIFWNWHESEKDCYDFSGSRNLARFLSLCHERGLYVLLRTGPYCCAEWNYGGFPAWLREEPGIVFRTFNQPYLQRVEKFFAHLFAEIVPSLATRGGSVVLVQLENEYANIAERYKEEGDRYLAWMLDLGLRSGIDVPIVMCEGGAPGSIEALNGFSISDERIADFTKRCPDQPLVWTELWTGWYDTWGYQRHLRDPRNLAYHLLRFIAAGGTAWNYYMWHGGTNFDRTSMYLQATSYGFDAPLDEWGRHTPKGKYLAALHEILLAQSDLLLEGTRRRNSNTVVWKRGRRQLVIHLDPTTHRASLCDETGHVVFDTEDAWQEHAKMRCTSPWKRLLDCSKGEWIPEPLPSERTDEAYISSEPIDQLLLTGDETDYCWYSHLLTQAAAGMHELRLPQCGDFLRVFVNGFPVARSLLPLKECRGSTLLSPVAKGEENVNALEKTQAQYEATFRIKLAAGPNRIDILCAALGLIKGDWMVSGPMTDERKGIWGKVFLDDSPLRGWEMRPGLQADPAKASTLAVPRRGEKHLGWWSTKFELKAAQLIGDRDFAVNLTGWDKGMAFLNGEMLGRYWLIEGHGYGGDEAWHGLEENGLFLTKEGEPTQFRYRLPLAWLGEVNELVLFEEGVPSKPCAVSVESRKVLL